MNILRFFLFGVFNIRFRFSLLLVLIYIFCLLPSVASAQTLPPPPPGKPFITLWSLDGVTSISFNVFFSDSVSHAFTWYELDNDNNVVASDFGSRSRIDGANLIISGLNTGNASGHKLRVWVNDSIIQTKQITASTDTSLFQLLSVEQWGNAKWVTMTRAFMDCKNMDVSATDFPNLDNCESLQQMFAECRNLKGNSSFNNWKVSTIINMNRTFYHTGSFNPNLSSWDVSKVSDFQAMFNFSSFNQDISSWNVSNAENMDYMFRNTPFNHDLSSWCVPKITFTPTQFSDDWASFPKPNWGSCNIWKGETSTDFNTGSNWIGGNVPGAGIKVINFHPHADRDMHLDGSKSYDWVNFTQSNKKIVLGDHDFTVGNLKSNSDTLMRFQTNGTGQVITSINSANSFRFNVGNNVFTPLTIHNKTTSSDEFKVRVVDGVKSQGITGSDLGNDKRRVDHVWVINKGTSDANSGNGIDFEFGWNVGSEKSPSHSSDKGFEVVSLNKFNTTSNDWELASSGNNNYTPGNQNLLFTGYKGDFSNFAISGSASALPVNLSRFNVQLSPLSTKMAELTWSTFAEENASHFDIQKSLDGQHFITIGSINAVGFSHETSDYHFLDMSPSKINYYRLSQVDFDGKTSISPVRMLIIKDNVEEKNVTRVYPNPSNGTFHIQTPYTDNITTEFKLYDLKGSLIKEGFLNPKTTISNISNGLYKLHVISPSSYETISIIIQD
jgi:hypothetical protein